MIILPLASGGGGASFPPSNKILKAVFTDIPISGTADFTIFNQTFASGGILKNVKLFRRDAGAPALETSLTFYGFKFTLNGGAEQSFLNGGSNLGRTAIMGSLDTYQQDCLLLDFDIDISFTSSLIAKLRLDKSGSNIICSAVATYYEL